MCDFIESNMYSNIITVNDTKHITDNDWGYLNEVLYISMMNNNKYIWMEWIEKYNQDNISLMPSIGMFRWLIYKLSLIL